MIEVLEHIDDVKKIRKLLLGGLTQDALKACDVTIAHNQKKVDEFEKWAEEESQRDYDRSFREKRKALQDKVKTNPFPGTIPEGVS
tara:strand:+ start:268 stop:525 length:258 start_codon:yes stop_codon:yes gene_type:complete